jgi:hypothetical protein
VTSDGVGLFVEFSLEPHAWRWCGDQCHAFPPHCHGGMGRTQLLSSTVEADAAGAAVSRFTMWAMSVALGWHYAIDGIVGAAGAATCYWTCGAWLRRRGSGLQVPANHLAEVIR